MVPSPIVHDWLSTTAMLISSATARDASSALWIVAESPPLRLITTMPVAPSAMSARYSCSNNPGGGAAVSGRTADAADLAQNSFTVRSRRSMNSSAPKRMESGTMMMPNSSASAWGRSQALSVTIRTVTSRKG